MAAETPTGKIRLIVNGDDFGISSAANRAIVKAHKEGILTTTSLMVAGNAAGHALSLAKRNPSLGVGLHLTLAAGKSTLKPTEIPGIVNQRFEFDPSPVRAGLRYFFIGDLRPRLRQEINAQFAEFRLAELPLDHVNGHLHFHLHPTVFGLIKRHWTQWGINAVRLTNDPLWTNLKLARGRYVYRLSHALIFGILSRRARTALARRSIKHADATFGLLQNDHLDEQYLISLLQSLAPGTYEVFCHPDESDHAHETAALTSPKVREIVQDRGIELIRYQDL
jgi:chitin disaccharide deacetylase